MLSLGSCVDDMLQGPQDVPEGEPALLTLNIAMAGRAEVTRADVPDYRITSYWIGIFDAASGKLKASKIVDKLRKVSGKRWRSRPPPGVLKYVGWPISRSATRWMSGKVTAMSFLSARLSRA
jgi:hypothetical protein